MSRVGIKRFMEKTKMEENEMERRGKVRDKMEKTTHKALKRGIFFFLKDFFQFFFFLED